MTKMVYENYKASYEKDGIFLKILERLQTFFSLPESSKIESIQRYFRCIIYRAKMISIPFFRNDFNSHLRGQWKHNKSLTKTSKITYLIRNNQKKKDSTWFAKIESKYRSRNATWKIEKSDLRHVNLPFVSAVKKVPSRKVDMLHSCSSASSLYNLGQKSSKFSPKPRVRKLVPSPFLFFTIFLNSGLYLTINMIVFDHSIFPNNMSPESP